MRVLVNTTTLVMGGSLQVCAELFNQILKADEYRNIEWHFACSDIILGALRSRGIQLGDRSSTFAHSPAKSMASRRRLRLLEKEIEPDCVFTLFGPAYVRFRAPHVCGIADGWVTHCDRVAFGSLPSVMNKLHMLASIVHKGIWYRAADRWIVEAEVARGGFSKRFRVPKSHISVITNCCGEHYLEYAAEEPNLHYGSKIKILTLSAAHPNKNIDIIPGVAYSLKQHNPDIDAEFITTLPHENAMTQRLRALSKEFGVEKMVRNIGPVSLADGPALYNECSICFLPSVLETFSANYPEAMAMKRPIVTTDLDFAHNICGDAALYYEPMIADSAADTIRLLIESPQRVKDLVSNGVQRLQEFDSSKERLDKIVELLISVVHKRSTNRLCC